MTETKLLKLMSVGFPFTF